MALNLSSLIVDKSTNNNLLLSTCIEENFTYSTLDFLNETKVDFINCKKELYKSIITCNNNQSLNEAFTDYFGKIKEIIKKFINFLSSLIKRFIISLNKLVLSDKYLKKHESDFSKFTSDMNFKYDGYIFTFDDNIPEVNAKAKFEQDFIDLDFDDLIKSNKNDQQISNDIAEKRAKLISRLDKYGYDEFRGWVIGKDGIKIDSEDFKEELFRVYRNGEIEKDEFDIDVDKVMESLTFIKNYEKFINSIKTTKKNMEKEYKAVESLLNKMIIRNKDNNLGEGIIVSDDYDGRGRSKFVVSDKVITQLDLYVKAKITELETMTTIHSLAFSCKLDAGMDCFKQCKNILYKALSTIEKRKEK